MPPDVLNGIYLMIEILEWDHIRRKLPFTLLADGGVGYAGGIFRARTVVQQKKTQAKYVS